MHVRIRTALRPAYTDLRNPLLHGTHDSEAYSHLMATEVGMVRMRMEVRSWSQEADDAFLVKGEICRGRGCHNDHLPPGPGWVAKGGKWCHTRSNSLFSLYFPHCAITRGRI